MIDDLGSRTRLPEDERRRDDRTRLIIDLFFDGIGATGVASTRDLSVGGLYMNTLASLPEGGLLRLRLTFGNEEVVVSATVVYSNPGRGVGVHFHDLSESDRAVIERASRESHSLA